MLSRDRAAEQAAELMIFFAQRTGLDAQRPKQRYLWTDAFAVCNFLSLAQATGDERFTELALRLVEQVHHVLGRHRAEDSRSGWISGLGEEEGKSHPTRGGLRIGKKLPERSPGEPFDELLEWDRDGQYFHYLTQWMHALDQLSRATGQSRFNLWARELAEAAHAGFSYAAPGSGRRLVGASRHQRCDARDQPRAGGQPAPVAGPCRVNPRSCDSTVSRSTAVRDARATMHPGSGTWRRERLDCAL